MNCKCMASFRNVIFIPLHLFSEVYLALLLFVCCTARLSLYTTPDVLTVTTLYLHPFKATSTSSFCYSSGNLLTLILEDLMV